MRDSNLHSSPSPQPICWALAFRLSIRRKFQFLWFSFFVAAAGADGSAAAEGAAGVGAAADGIAGGDAPADGGAPGLLATAPSLLSASRSWRYRFFAWVMAPVRMALSARRSSRQSFHRSKNGTPALFSPFLSRALRSASLSRARTSRTASHRFSRSCFCSARSVCNCSSRAL